MFLSHKQNAQKYHNIQKGNKSFESGAKFKYLGKPPTNHNHIHAEIKSRLTSGNACYYSAQKLLSSCLLSKNIKIKIYRTVSLSVGCETWSLTLREDYRVLTKISGPKTDKVTRECKTMHNEELYDLSSSTNIIWMSKSRRMRWVGHVARMGERRGAYRVWWGN
jgi:hypothetical protein